MIRTKRFALALAASCILMTPIACRAPAGETQTPQPTPTAMPTAVTYAPFRPTATPEPLVSAPAWSEGATIYLVFVRSFCDSDGDGIGDLRGLSEKLDYLDDLGVDAIWLLPVFSAASYHGYDTIDHYTIQPEYGTQEDLVHLVRACHQRGIRVIVDLVSAAVSNQHPYFAEAYGNPDSPYSDWFTWYDQAHTKYKAFANIDIVPSLQGENPAVLEHFAQITRHWLDLGGEGEYIDGYRLDHAIGVPHANWKHLRAQLKALNPDLLLLGEVWDKAPVIARYYRDEFDSTFDFPLYHILAGQEDTVGHGVLGGGEKPGLIEASLLQRQRLYPWGAQSVTFLNNHDTNRVMSVIGQDPQRARLAATLLFTLPGAPLIYYGEEIGMAGVKGDGRPYWDEFRREPMDWYAAEAGPGMCTWFQPADRHNRPHDSVSVEEQADDPSSLLSHYRRLAALRRAHPALRTGGHERVPVLSGGDQIYSFLRQDAHEHLLVILNFSTQPAEAVLDVGASSLPAGPWESVDLLTGARPAQWLGDTCTVRVEANSGLVLLLARPEN